MVTLQKPADRDFVILNLTDPQLSSTEWETDTMQRILLKNTLRELVNRTKPDLITVCGDIAWAGETYSYECFTSYVDSFGIPWAPIFGNHDVQAGYEKTCEAADILIRGKNCLFEKGPRELGCGNYVIRIMEGECPVTALILMDSHDSRPPLPHEMDVDTVWDEISPRQIDWYRNETELLKSQGYRDSALLLHIPIYAYRDAFHAASIKGFSYNHYEPQSCSYSAFWNEGYGDTFGVNYEKICSHPYDNGFFKVIGELDHTRHVLCGHDHVNNASINYRGVRLTYVTKLGAGCYYDKRMNGGTVLTVGSHGIKDIRHEYVSAEKVLYEEEDN